jgi:hypothetical protein
MTCVQDCIQASILSMMIPVRFILTHVTEGFVEVQCTRHIVFFLLAQQPIVGLYFAAL